jgi:hypothetical protein
VTAPLADKVAAAPKQTLEEDPVSDKTGAAPLTLMVEVA